VVLGQASKWCTHVPVAWFIHTEYAYILEFLIHSTWVLCESPSSMCVHTIFCISNLQHPPEFPHQDSQNSQKAHTTLETLTAHLHTNISTSISPHPYLTKGDGGHNDSHSCLPPRLLHLHSHGYHAECSGYHLCIITLGGQACAPNVVVITVMQGNPSSMRQTAQQTCCANGTPKIQHYPCAKLFICHVHPMRIGR
jgi:hypothetical protein